MRKDCCCCRSRSIVWRRKEKKMLELSLMLKETMESVSFCVVVENGWHRLVKMKFFFITWKFGKRKLLSILMGKPFPVCWQIKSILKKLIPFLCPLSPSNIESSMLFELGFEVLEPKKTSILISFDLIIRNNFNPKKILLFSIKSNTPSIISTALFLPLSPAGLSHDQLFTSHHIGDLRSKWACLDGSSRWKEQTNQENGQLDLNPTSSLSSSTTKALDLSKKDQLILHLNLTNLLAVGQFEWF